MEEILAVVSRFIFGELNNYGYWFWDPFYQHCSILGLLSFVTVGLYVLSRVQRKKQTCKPLKITTTKALLIPTIMLIIYTTFLIMLNINALFINEVSHIFYYGLRLYGVSGFGVFIPCLIAAMVVSYFVGRRQRRKEHTTAINMRKQQYKPTTD
jgi:hypothetical protein